MRFAPCAVVAPYRHQAGVFALRAGVGLQGHCVVAGALGQPLRQLIEHCGVAFDLLSRCKGVHTRKLGPRDRNHFCSRIKFHGATTQRNH